jgi:hypothetical protein
MSTTGEILNEEFLKPLGLTANALAKAIGVPLHRLRIHETDDRRPAGFVSTFREFSNCGNVAVILFDS